MSSLPLLLASSTTYLWHWYNPQLMQIVNFPAQQFNQVGASGTCPHCSVNSYFKPITSAHVEAFASQSRRVCNGAQCEACKNFVLVVGESFLSQPWKLEGVYPLGKPNDSVATEVPPAIREDFREALRCEWVKAYKATATMCRRALQASCVELGAKDGKLRDQIDDLKEKGLITQLLKELAHEVRAIGNDGAHPGSDGLNDVTENDAREIIDFTREFFHHVFVVRAKLKARQTPPAAAAAPATP